MGNYNLKKRELNTMKSLLSCAVLLLLSPSQEARASDLSAKLQQGRVAGLRRVQASQDSYDVAGDVFHLHGDDGAGGATGGDGAFLNHFAGSSLVVDDTAA